MPPQCRTGAPLRSMHWCQILAHSAVVAALCPQGRRRGRQRDHG